MQNQFNPPVRGSERKLQITPLSPPPLRSKDDLKSLPPKAISWQ